MVHGTCDTIANSSTIAKQGGDNWYFLTADYAFGEARERETGQVVQESGGKVLGSVRHPLNTSDFSSCLGLANAGGAALCR